MDGSQQLVKGGVPRIFPEEYSSSLSGQMFRDFTAIQNSPHNMLVVGYFLNPQKRLLIVRWLGWYSLNMLCACRLQENTAHWHIILPLTACKDGFDSFRGHPLVCESMHLSLVVCVTVSTVFDFHFFFLFIFKDSMSLFIGNTFSFAMKFFICCPQIDDQETMNRI